MTKRPTKEQEPEKEEAFGWGDTVDVPESGHVLLPEGRAFFSVTKLERQRKEFGSFGTINVAVMSFTCFAKDGDGEADVQVQFGLVRSLGWKILQLATACGFRKPGDGNEIDPRWWGEFVGAEGSCTIAHRGYATRKGEKRTANDIAEFLPPEDAEKKQPEF
jgi:hypothetical protein